jgi:hypothetical protein
MQSEARESFHMMEEFRNTCTKNIEKKKGDVVVEKKQPLA